jgi:3-oxoacyl-[acyl-carrier protein] reductase
MEEEIAMTQWSQQVALVTGGSRGLGRAIVRRFAAEGAAVAINYAVRRDAAEALAAKVRAGGGRAIAVQADVADAGAVAAMVARVEAELGGVSILVNNAGIIWTATLETFEPEGFARLSDVHVIGTINAVRAVMGGMKAARYGRIVNLSSIAAFCTTSFMGNHFYSAVKAALNALTRRFAWELGPFGITVNAIAPGYVLTDMNRGSLSSEEWQKTQAVFAAKAMLGRVGEPEDIAHAVAYFASPAASWVTAQVLVVDGGRTDFIAHG